jgi:2'-5' RNA ligase
MAGRVTAVVCAAFDAATDEEIYAVRERVRAAGVILPDHPPHRPHFSLSAAAVPREELEGVLAVVTSVAARHDPIALRLTEVGRFGRAGVIWLGPPPNPALAALQRDVHDALAEKWPPAFGERSSPRQWVAHCTLATRVRIPKLREVQRQVSTTYKPITGSVDALATILVGGRGDVGHVRLGLDHGP